MWPWNNSNHAKKGSWFEAISCPDSFEKKTAQPNWGFPGYAENEQMCGVLAFRLCLPSEPRAAPHWNVEQNRWLQLMREDIARGCQARLSDEVDAWDKVHPGMV